MAKVTQEVVFDACNSIVESGEKLTVAKVRSITGGSFNTLCEFVNLWKSQNTRTHASVIAPDAVKSAMLLAANTLYEAALEAARAEVSALRDELRDETANYAEQCEIEVAKALEKVALVEQQNELLNIEKKEIEGKLNAANFLNNELNTGYKEKRIELDKLNERLQRVEAERTTYRDKVVELESDKKELENKNELLANSLGAADNKMDELRSQLHHSKKIVDMMNEASKEDEVKIARLEERVTNAESDRYAIAERWSEEKEKVEAMLAEKDTLVAALAELKNENKWLAKSVADFEKAAAERAKKEEQEKAKKPDEEKSKK